MAVVGHAAGVSVQSGISTENTMMEKDTNPVVLEAVELLKNIRCFNNCSKKTDISKTPDGYPLDKECIRRVFDGTSGDALVDIKARLTLIDVLYSTQVGSHRHYGLDDLAKAVFGFQKRQDRPLKDVFKVFAKDPDQFTSLFGEKGATLWDGRYGIGSKADEKGKAISLISKYAYFETGGEFPIYDSIARGMIRALWPFMATEKMGRKPADLSLLDIVCFVNKLNLFKGELGKCAGFDVDYDTLDCLMWFVGKMFRMSFTLVFPKEVYGEFVERFGNNGKIAKVSGEKRATREEKANAVKSNLATLQKFLEDYKAENDYMKLLFDYCHFARNLAENGVFIS